MLLYLYMQKLFKSPKRIKTWFLFLKYETKRKISTLFPPKKHGFIHIFNIVFHISAEKKSFFISIF